MDKRKSLINITFAISFKIVLTITSLILRRFVIQNLGIEANGIYSLYLSIIGILSIAELGIGSAIIYSMYDPISKGDKSKIAALYNFYNKAYKYIAFSVLTFGLLVLPFLRVITNTNLSYIQLVSTYLIMLLSVFTSYFYSSRLALIDAHKNNYIATLITSITLLIQHIFQIIILLIFKSFELYLLARLLTSLLNWAIIYYYTNKKYREYTVTKDNIDKNTKQEIVKNVQGMFLHKVGAILVNSTDSIIISTFIGIVVFSLYSNYISIVVAMISIITLFFFPLTAVIGHYAIKKDNQGLNSFYIFFYDLNYLIGFTSFVFFFLTIDDIITLFFGDNLTLSRNIVFIIALNYFIQFLRTSNQVFRDATGNFYRYKWKPLIEGGLNLFLSLLFVFYIGLEGVIIATIFTNLTVNNIIEPLIIHKYVLQRKIKHFYFKNYIGIIIFISTLLVLNNFLFNEKTVIANLFFNTLLASLVSVVSLLIILISSRELRIRTNNLIKRIISIVRELSLRRKK